MTNPNDNVQWYDHAHGFQMFFPNGYGLAIIPGYNGDTMEVTVVDGEGAAIPDNNGDTMEFVTPAMLGNYINRVRDLPPRTGCSPLAPDETIEGGESNGMTNDEQMEILRKAGYFKDGEDAYSLLAAIESLNIEIESLQNKIKEIEG